MLPLLVQVGWVSPIRMRWFLKQIGPMPCKALTLNCTWKQISKQCSFRSSGITWASVAALRTACTAAFCAIIGFQLFFKGRAHSNRHQTRDDQGLCDLRGSGTLDPGKAATCSCAKVLLTVTATCSLNRGHESRRTPKLWIRSVWGTVPHPEVKMLKSQSTPD